MERRRRVSDNVWLGKLGRSPIKAFSSRFRPERSSTDRGSETEIHAGRNWADRDHFGKRASYGIDSKYEVSLLQSNHTSKF